jgi:PTS system fructose-specific IIC component
MTGVSYMIPFVAAGGILIALGFMLSNFAFGEDGPVEIVKYGIGKEGAYDIVNNFNPLTITSWAALMFVIGGRPSASSSRFSGFIAFAIADRPGLVPGIVGGFIANAMSAGFLGGIVTGILGGLIARWIAGWNVPGEFGASCRSSSSRCSRSSSPPGSSSPCSDAPSRRS